MPAYEIIHVRRDMPTPCKAIKWADTPEEAVEHLCSGSKKKGYLLKKVGVACEIKEIKEL